MNVHIGTTSSVERRIFSLLQLNQAVKKAIHQATGDRSFWIKAEITGISRKGHVYLELAQHDNGVRVAVMRGVIWRTNLVSIEEMLGTERDAILKEGAEILFKACVQFHEIYGLSLLIDEIDLSFSLGELERRKLATIAALREEGLFDLNRSVKEPMVIQRIALISSSGTAAYADFMKHLNENEYGYRFHVRLFNSIVQGESAARELREAIAMVQADRFDAIVLIRGGGSKLDLEAFNDLELCRTIARMPIPVMTGIGHETDLSVVDMIAKSPHKTPTAIADHLIDKCLYFETGLSGFMVNIHKSVIDRSSVQKQVIERWKEMLEMRPKNHCQRRRGELHTAVGALQRNVTEAINKAGKRIENHRSNLAIVPLHRIQAIESSRLRGSSAALTSAAQRGVDLMLGRITGMREAISLISPERSLSRGFSITRKNGKVITDPRHLENGDVIETQFAHGKSWSRIEKIEPNGE